jgi:hypothetical protein
MHKIGIVLLLISLHIVAKPARSQMSEGGIIVYSATGKISDIAPIFETDTISAVQQLVHLNIITYDVVTQETRQITDAINTGGAFNVLEVAPDLSSILVSFTPINEESNAFGIPAAVEATLEAGIYLIDFDGNLLGQIPGIPDGLTTEHMDWSPNGTYLVYGALVRSLNQEGEVDGWQNQIVTYDFITEESRVVTAFDDDAGVTAGLNWSLDGTQIYFTYRGEPHVVNVDGSNLQKIPVQTSVHMGDLTLSPDGKTFLFEDSGQIYVMPTTGGDPQSLLIDGHDPSWSPSGQRIVYSSQSNVELPQAMFFFGTHQQQLFTADANGSNKTALIVSDFLASGSPIWVTGATVVIDSTTAVLPPEQEQLILLELEGISDGTVEIYELPYEYVYYDELFQKLSRYRDTANTALDIADATLIVIKGFALGASPLDLTCLMVNVESIRNDLIVDESEQETTGNQLAYLCDFVNLAEGFMHPSDPFALAGGTISLLKGLINADRLAVWIGDRVDAFPPFIWIQRLGDETPVLCFFVREACQAVQSGGGGSW